MAKDKDPEPVAEQLVRLLGAAGPADLETLDGTIALKEKDLAALRAVRRLVAISLGVEEEKRGVRRKPAAATRPGAPAERASTTEERRAKCVRYIAKNGPTKGAELCRLFDIPVGSQTGVLDHEWFERTDKGFALSAAGNDASRRLAAVGA